MATTKWLRAIEVSGTGLQADVLIPVTTNLGVVVEVVEAAEIAVAQGKMLIGAAGGLAAAMEVTGDITISESGVTAIGAKKVIETMIALADGKIFVGDAGADASAVTLSGDATMTNLGALTITPPTVRVLTNSLTAASMTDGLGTVATKTLAGNIPAGAIILGVKVLVSVGFAGDTNALCTIGDGSVVDRYNTGTPNLFATAATGVEFGVPSGAKLQLVAVSPVVTITSTADATNMIAGGGVASISIYYIQT